MIQSKVYDLLPAPVDFCGLPVRPVDQRQLINAMILRAKQRIRTSVHYLNAHTFNLCQTDPDFHKILATSDLLYADGMSVVWAGRWLGCRIPERLSAADYFETFCRLCAEEEVSLFLLGGDDGVSQIAADALKKRVPALHITGTYGGYYPDEDSHRIIEHINAREADVLVVGMGSPRQESWVAKYGHELNVPVRWTVGALFDYFADREPRAPRWLCRCGAEWLYRWMHKPKERWSRYVLGNSRFLWSVMREKITRRNNHRIA